MSSAYAAPPPAAPGPTTPSSAAPSAPPSVAASTDTAPTSTTSHANGHKPESESAALGAGGPLDLVQFAFSVGFMQQQWADIQLVFFGTSLKLHRLVLARSPYLASVMSTLGIGATYHIQLPDLNVTEESLFICLHHLYTPSLHLVNSTNARAVLATAHTLGGLPDLTAHAYAVVRSGLDAPAVVGLVRWLCARPAVYGSVGGAEPAAADDWEGAGAPYGPWSERLKQDVVDYLLHGLPAQLAQAAPSEPLHASPTLLSTYVALPYALFKQCVESAALPIGSMQDRFSFAKRAIALRKKKAAAAAAAGGQGGPGAAGAQAAAEESVVLALKGGDGMDVHVTRKARRSRSALWKVEG